MISRRFLKIGVACLLPLLANSAFASSSCRKLPQELSKEYRRGSFLLQYELTGANALADTVDINKNKIPDLVEDVAIQLETTRALFTSFNFIDPLKQPRYKSQDSELVLVQFLDMTGNGLAFDDAQQNRQGDCVLLINLSNKLSARNLSPAHEWFHLVQYGYTPFKRAWFLEGMARWAESALRKESTKASFGSPVQDSELFSQSYDAQWYWVNYASAGKGGSQQAVPSAVRNARYVNGDSVLQDDVFVGPARIRAALEALGRLGEQESTRRKLNPYAWPETTQRLAEHDEPMKQAVENIGSK